MFKLTHLFTQLLCLSFVGFFSSPNISTSLSHFTARGAVSPHVPPLLPLSSFSRSSLWITPERSRNRAGCQLDERGHTGPADLVLLSHHKAYLSVSHFPPLPESLFHMHIQSRLSQISLSARFSLCRAIHDVKGFLRTVLKTVPSYQASAQL